MRDTDTPAVFHLGRYVNWLVLLLIVLAILYSLWIVIENWNAITV